MNEVNHCPDCGNKVEAGDIEWDKHNIIGIRVYYCEFCEEVWKEEHNRYDDSTTYWRGSDDD